MRIDAHQHFWQLSRGDYGWLTPSQGILYRDYLPDDLVPHLADHSIEATIVVQAAPTVAETEYLLGLAATYPFIGGVVGWLDLDDAGFAHEFARLRKNPRLVGLRPMLQDLPDPAWILRPQVLDNLRLLAAEGFPIDLLVKPPQLPYALRALEQVADLRAIVDHIAKPDIAAGQWHPWADQLTELAGHPHVYCKLSGMATEAGPRWTPDTLRPYIEHAVARFGWNRVVFGSDWPVCLLAGTYDRIVAALREALGGKLTAAREQALFGDNAAAFYGITP